MLACSVWGGVLLLGDCLQPDRAGKDILVGYLTSLINNKLIKSSGTIWAKNLSSWVYVWVVNQKRRTIDSLTS